MPASVVGAARTPSDGTDATGASLALTIPAGTAVDDYAVLIVELWDSTATNPTLTYPAGFTQIVNYVSSTDGFQKQKVALKKLTAADSGTYTVSGFASHFRQGHVVILRGIDLTTALDVAVNLAQNSTGTALPANSLTTVTAGCLILYTVSNENTCTQSTNPTGYTKQLDSNYLKTNTKVAGAAGTETPSGGAFSTSTLKLGVLLAFRPAAASGTAMNLGAATGSGAAQAMSTGKTWTAGAAGGSGAAQAMGSSKAITLGAAAGTGTPQAMSFTKGMPLGPATGSGAAQAAAFTGAATLALDAATGSGAPQAMSFTKGLALSTATGSGAPAGIADAKAVALSAAAGTGAAQVLTPGKAPALQTATGSGAAQVMGFTAAGSLAMGTVAGTGAPQAMSFAKAWALSTAAGSGAAQALVRSKALALGVATDTGTVQALAPAKQLALAAAISAGGPQPMTFAGPPTEYDAPETWTASTRAAAVTIVSSTHRHTAATRLSPYTATTREP